VLQFDSAPEYSNHSGGVLVAKQAILVDIDGTIADNRHRDHLAKTDWAKFVEFDTVMKDKPIASVVELVRLLALQYRVVMVTAREESDRSVSNAWLIRHGIPFHGLYMRPIGDERRAHDFKESVLHTLQKEGFEVLLAIEDNKYCVDMYRKNGIQVLEVTGYGRQGLSQDTLGMLAATQTPLSLEETNALLGRHIVDMATAAFLR